MKAAVYRGVGRVEVEELPVPEIGPQEVLVRVHSCGVCGTDLKKIQYGLVPPPRVFGHETAGTVAAVGPGETEFATGDRVVVQHHVPCRDCFFCRRRLYASCAVYRQTGVTAGFVPAGGGFAEFVRVMPFVRPGVVRIPDGVSFETASFLEPLNTVLKGVRALGLVSGDTALVVGQGPIGLLFTQCLRAEGVGVIASDLQPSRRELSRQFGALPLDPRSDDPVAACRAQTDGRGADGAVVAVASTAVVGTALDAVRPGGRVLLFAQTRMGEALEIDAGQICVQEKALLGSYSADIDLQPTVAEMLFSGQIQVGPLVTHRFPLDRIGEALALASNPTPDSLKVLVQP